MRPRGIRSRPVAAGLSTGVLAALALAGCDTVEQEGQDGPDAPSARLVVEQRLVPGFPMPVEGSIGFFELRGADTQPVASGRIPTTRRASLLDRRLPAGEYTLISYQRPCVANCGRLAPSTDRCEESIALEPGERVTAVVRVRHGESCRITTR